MSSVSSATSSSNHSSTSSSTDTESSEKKQKATAELKSLISTISDMDTSTSAVVSLLANGSLDTNSLGPEQLQALELAIQDRLQQTSMMTNILKTLHEAAMAVIRNMRP